MQRREFITLLGSMVIASPRGAFAQTSKIHRLGTLTVGPPIFRQPPEPERFSSLDWLSADTHSGKISPTRPAVQRARSDQTPQLMQELKAANVDVVVTVSYPAAVAAKASGVPTVIASGSGDPVATGLVESLARPGGNVTGISDDAATLSTKRLGLLKEMLPHLRRVAMLWNKDDLGMSLRYEASAKAAQEIGVTVQPLGYVNPTISMTPLRR